MKTRRALRHQLIGSTVVALFIATPISALQAPGVMPGGCVEPPRRPSEVGRYLSAIQPIDQLPDEPLFSHLYLYPTRAAAEGTKSHSASTVAESLDKVWVFTIASRNGGRSLATASRLLAYCRFHARNNTQRDTWKPPSRRTEA